jgi:hypothetical protein
MKFWIRNDYGNEYDTVVDYGGYTRFLREYKTHLEAERNLKQDAVKFLEGKIAEHKALISGFEYEIRVLTKE